MADLPVYLDYQATTPVDLRVQEAMVPYWNQTFGNPHSRGHRFGWDARRAVAAGRSQVADLIGADDDEIVFVSGATESCNLALRGVATTETERRQIITLTTEHPAVLETVRSLAQRGFEIQVLPVTSNGLLDLAVLANTLSDRTLLVSVMLANNEIGVVQPLAEISRLCRSVGAALHTDATQAVGRMKVNVDELGIDLASLSGHKIYGPNGVGALYVRNRPELHLEPLLSGGTQERGLRPGTVATPLVVGLGRACEIANDEWRSDANRLQGLTARLQSQLMEAVPNLRIFGHSEHRIPGNLALGVPGVLADRLVNVVSDRVAISTGSACATGSPEPSSVLLALGLGREIAATGVRISLGRFTTRDEVDMAADVLCRAWRSMTDEGGIRE